MSEIQGIARQKIHPGKLDEFKRLATECMRSAREKDSGTLQYDFYFNTDETECIVYEPACRQAGATGTPPRSWSIRRTSATSWAR